MEKHKVAKGENLCKKKMWKKMKNKQNRLKVPSYFPPLCCQNVKSLALSSVTVTYTNIQSQWMCSVWGAWQACAEFIKTLYNVWTAPGSRLHNPALSWTEKYVISGKGVCLCLSAAPRPRSCSREDERQLCHECDNHSDPPVRVCNDPTCPSALSRLRSVFTCLCEPC